MSFFYIDIFIKRHFTNVILPELLVDLWWRHVFRPATPWATWPWSSRRTCRHSGGCWSSCAPRARCSVCPSPSASPRSSSTARRCRTATSSSKASRVRAITRSAKKAAALSCDRFFKTEFVFQYCHYRACFVIGRACRDKWDHCSVTNYSCKTGATPTKALQLMDVI